MFQDPLTIEYDLHQCFQPPLLCHVVLDLEYSEDKVNIPVIIHRPSLYHLSWKLIKHLSTKIWTLNQTNRPFNLCTNLISFDISSYYTLFFPLSIKKANTSCLELVQDNFSLSYKHEKHPPTKKKKLVYLTVLARDLYFNFFFFCYFTSFYKGPYGICCGSLKRTWEAGDLTATPCQQIPPLHISWACSREIAYVALRDTSHVSVPIKIRPTTVVETIRTNPALKLRPQTNP